MVVVKRFGWPVPVFLKALRLRVSSTYLRRTFLSLAERTPPREVGSVWS